MEPAQKNPKTNISEKSRLCKNFFSTSGCPFGENCHYLHHVDPKLQYNPVIVQNSARNSKKTSEGFTPAKGYKTHLCKNYGSDEGCVFGDKCHFSHGENDLGRDSAKASFGDLSKAEISFSASLASGIIGKGGANTKKICHLTGVKLHIKDHESDPRLKNIEFEGPFESITKAADMVRELIERIEMLSRKELGDEPNDEV
ncbi:hypothetical protein SUGI_0809240 [Cryptomeria japonica]|uniref:zinc finger CCCH domain-containing protein 14-like n=1 Tax=Cryptomeria japonica TaxID=3369 RepID=UPI002414C68B|nr:zinc finger CCCH domain-containing protein 14-like [Cryptomeria japonica]GLJ39596.1 hypothetical protein SUGI_0809240 [Cryptomeria japonica]